MTSQRESLEKYFEKYRETVSQGLITLELHMHDINYPVQYQAWQAAQPDQASTIAQLQLDLSAELNRVSSYKMLVESLEGQLSHYRDKDYKLSERRLNGLEQSLISEQQMNETLTNENVQLQADNARMREALEFYSDCNHFDNNSNGSVTIVDHGEVADEALATQPTLAEHDDKRIEAIIFGDK